MGRKVDQQVRTLFLFIFPPEKLRNEKVLAEEYSKRKQLEVKVATGIKIPAQLSVTCSTLLLLAVRKCLGGVWE